MSNDCKWLPIETAPDDGTKVLLRFDPPFYDVEEDGVAVGRWLKTGYWWLSAIWASTDAHRHPSHWMPLPSPPSALAGEAAQAAETEGLGSRASDGEAGTPEATPSMFIEGYLTDLCLAGKHPAQDPKFSLNNPSISPPPSPRKGQEENPCPMTVEEPSDAAIEAGCMAAWEVSRPFIAREFCGGNDPGTWSDQEEYLRAITRQEVRAAYQAIRASEEDR